MNEHAIVTDPGTPPRPGGARSVRRTGRRGRARSTTPATDGRPPGAPAGRARGAAGPRCDGARVGPPPARPSRATTAAAEPPPTAGRPRRWSGTGSCGSMPARRPVRPRRWRNEATVPGASIWMTRSRSPTSMPSSRVLVETMTQSRASAKASSARRRSSTDSEAWDRNVVTPLGAQTLHRVPRPAAGTRRTPGASRPGAGQRSPSPRWPGSRRSRARRRPGGGQLSDGSPSRQVRRDNLCRAVCRAPSPAASPAAASGLPTVAERPTRWTGRPATRSSRSSTASRCQPRSSPANACTSSTTIARSPVKKARWSTLALTSIASSDSGVVSSMSGRSRRIRFAAALGDIAVPERGCTPQPGV